ncbi:MAG: hypothetical protein Ta2G_04950 [Termitinemataceae bacterium]|nr:MAG: hypothetical protein Ta2G_04950 [Termitinemataceae bacterium]
MKKSLSVKFLGFTALYVVIFLVFSLVQFAVAGSFSRQLGDLRVSGTFAQAGNEKTQNAPNAASYGLNENNKTDDEYFVNDGVGVFFGGMEFFLSSQELYGLSYIDINGNQHDIRPQVMILSEESVKFKLENSIDLSFYVQRDDGGRDLIISAAMGEDVLGLQLPYRALKKAKIKSENVSETGNASLLVSYGGRDFMFDRPILDTSRRIINLNNKFPVVSYRIIQEEAAFNPVDFIISGAMEKTRYDELVDAWCSKALAGWEQQIYGGTTTNEELITAYVSETARRGSYSTAVDSVPASFKNSAARTFLSSPFLGRLDIGMRTLSNSERDTTALYTSMLREKSDNLLKESRVFEYIALRDRSVLFDEAIDYVKEFDLSKITPDMCAGIFEGWWSWWRWNEKSTKAPVISPLAPKSEPVIVENPFNPLLDAAMSLLQEMLKMDSENRNVFFVENNSVDVLYNIRLGTIIEEYGIAKQKSEWSALGRSLVLSTLNFATDSGIISSTLDKSSENIFSARENVDNLSTTTIYKNLRFCDYYPHPVGAGSIYSGVWFWTMSPSIAATYENNVLDIAVSFPTSQTHYMLISGIGAFSKIQMRDMDYRSDPQFESYDSPGWAYSAGERTLFVKLVHRNQAEHVKIFF